MLSGLRIVIIGYVWPEPDSSAAGRNMLALLTAMREQDHDIIFMTAATDSPHKADLRALNVAVESVRLNCDSFNDRMAALQPDVVVFDRYMTEEQFSWRVREVCPAAIRILNTEDLHSLRQSRWDAVRRGLHVDQACKNTLLAQREVASILRSDLTLVMSSAEYSLLTAYYQVPAAQLLYFPLLHSPKDCLSTPSTLPDYEQRRDFVSIGNFRHAPNWDAVLQLKQHIWPLLRKQVPGSQLRIYGAYPPKKATQLHNPTQGFFVEGWADDAEQVISQARVLLAPLRFGAGLKGKLLLAMETGTPSVTTAIGAEGIADTDKWPGACQDNIDAFVKDAATLYSDKLAWTTAQQAGFTCIKAFHPDAHVPLLLSTIQSLVTDPQTHRRPLFLQHLLWHHTLSSTKYMSQWIAAKNQQKL
ncbi:glycosyltransferase family 4 protein [Alteromonas sp. H39]|uniref:glycosyltransferase family 4 protein n=1 Tax=Alteromonas sp. H39 TaxID=3389876 RepID=UPI0039E1A4F4